VKAPRVKDISAAKTISPPLAPTNFFVQVSKFKFLMIDRTFRILYQALQEWTVSTHQLRLVSAATLGEDHGPPPQSTL
jgi:hypothetical protein